MNKKCGDCGSIDIGEYSEGIGTCNDCGQFVDLQKENKLAVIVKESGIEQTKAQYVLSQFQDFANQAAEWEQKTRELVITDASQTREMALAKSARMNLRDIRVAAEKTKKKLKEGILVEGRLIDAIYNFIEGITKPIEAELKEKEEFVERQEAARILKLKTDREEQLRPYGIDTQFYNLGSMSEQAFCNLLDMTKTAHEAKLAAAQKLEEERIAREKKESEEKAEREKAEVEERARVASENARLKAEAEERAAADRKRIAAEKKSREKQEAAAKAEREKAAAEIRRANEAAEKARRELAEKHAEEERVRKAEEDRIDAERRRMAAAGDVERLKAYIEKLKQVEVPRLDELRCREILLHINIAFAEVEKL
jgi:hypothetical protein